ncbi:hypothetical protein [Arthrobacter sp. MYb227]|uniref:hypothetical protein n=1 Tax=Arthrobacter sp. MYb227 TaxID=1848601 RepID=UPI0011B025B4|nr:hypothetical protein [Arthrobacter sp. MYb227]
MSPNEEDFALLAVAPVFSTTNVMRWLEHYRRLGFSVKPHDDNYGYASLDSVEIHVSHNPDHNPLTSAGCSFLNVADADAVYARWSLVSGGNNVKPIDTDYGMREGGHIDPDGNLLRYGSRS